MSKLNRKLRKLDGYSQKKLRALHDLETDLKYWKIMETTEKETLYYITADIYKQYEIDVSNSLKIPVDVRKKDGNK